MSIQPATRTYGGLLRDVKRKFGDESGVQLEDADILAWTNDGLQQIVTENKILRSKMTLPTVVDQSEYPLSDLNIHSISSLHYDGQPLLALPFVEAEETIITSDPDKEQTGTPYLWYLWNSTLTLYPKPDAVGTLTMFFTKAPTVVTGDPSQIIEMPNKYYPALVAYILQQAYEMDEDWQASQAKETQFKNALAEQREEDFLAADITYQVIREVD
jgi:hypothetical protein